MRYWRAFLLLCIALGTSVSAPAQEPTPATPMPPPSPAPESARSVPATRSIPELVRYEATGLSLLRPYVRGKVPVIFIHGLWSSPWSWERMIKTFQTDPSLVDHFQFWTFGYSTGDPIPYSAHLLRKTLREARRELDPEGTDSAFDRAVLVGHSMGGLLTKLAIVETGDKLWRVISDHPWSDLAGDPEDRELLQNCLVFSPWRETRRAIFISTPHLGSRIDRGLVGQLGSRLVRLPDPLRETHHRLVTGNPPTFFSPYFRTALPTSVDELAYNSPILKTVHDLKAEPMVVTHSIISLREGKITPKATDGAVTYDSAHLEGVASEKIVNAGHLCQDHPDVIEEVRRILTEHRDADPMKPSGR